MNTSNFTQLDCASDSDIIRTVMVMVILLAAGFGVFGNVLVMIIALKYTVQKNIHHLIINMAVSDTLVILFYSFRNICILIFQHVWSIIPHFSSNILCKFITFLEETSKVVSLITLAIISIERYRATRETALRVRPYTLTQRLVTVLSSWFVAMVFNSIFLYTYEVYYRNDSYICTFNFRVINILVKVLIIIFCFTIVASSCFIVLLSILTSIRLKRPPVIEGNLSDAQRRVRAKRISNAVKMVMCSVLLYFFCYSPFFFWIVLFINLPHDSSYLETLGVGCNVDLIGFTFDFMMLLNSCISPYVYVIFLPDFEEAGKKILCCK